MLMQTEANVSIIWVCLRARYQFLESVAFSVSSCAYLFIDSSNCSLFSRRVQLEIALQQERDIALSGLFR